MSPELPHRPLTWDLPTIEGCKVCAEYEYHVKHAIFGLDAECYIIDKLKHLCAVHNWQLCHMCWDTECGDNTNEPLKQVKRES